MPARAAFHLGRLFASHREEPRTAVTVPPCQAHARARVGAPGSRSLSLALLLVLLCALPAIAENCTDGVQGGNETDIDCGGIGECPRCGEGKKCKVNGDCAASEGGCANGKCFDIAPARAWVAAFAVFIALVGVLLASCIACEFRIRMQFAWSERARKSRKEKQAWMRASSIGMGFNVTSGEVFLDEDPAEQQARRIRATLLSRLVKLYVASKSHVGRVRQDAAILNVDTSILKRERAAAAAKLRSVSLVLIKQGTFVGMTQEYVDYLVGEAERAEEAIKLAFNDVHKVQDSRETLHGAEAILQEIVRILSKAPRAQRFFGSTSDVLTWELGDAELMKLQLDVELELETHKERAQQKMKTAMLATTPFVNAPNATQIVREHNWLVRLHQAIVSVVPNVFLMYPWFYLVFFGGMLVVFLAFAVKLGSDSNAELQEGGVLGETFLPVPGYYNLAEHSEQRGLVPLIYAIMHCALYCFCWLPVPFLRGIWRDVSSKLPITRKYMPIDDMIYFHKLLGVMILSFIFTGAILFMSALAGSCRDDRDARSCIAFDPPPVPGEFYNNEDTFDFDPFVNVLMLRKVVFVLWFPIMPLLHWTRGAAPKFLPSFVKHYWYEICYYAHHLIAHFTFVTAMICRFDVFYLALITWGLYYFDNIREFFTRTYSTEIVVRPLFGSQEESAEEKTSLIHTDASGMPTSMKLLIEVPPGFKINAGQWIYLMVPEISLVQWHPFSLASGSHDSFIELQVGIVGDKSHWIDTGSGTGTGIGTANVRKPSTKQEARGVLDPEIPPAQWQMATRPTFTYLLQDLLRRRISEMAYLDDPERQAGEVKAIKCMVRGPYGSTFTKCFDPHYTGCVIIGAGTGLTAALSVLREVLYRKKKGDRVPKYIWFVWSCRRVDDLLWCWDTLHALLMGALKDEVIKPGKKWSRNSNMLDWLGVTIYVTQADKSQLKEFVSRSATLLSEGYQLSRISVVQDAMLSPKEEDEHDDGLLKTNPWIGEVPWSYQTAAVQNGDGYESFDDDEKDDAYAHRISVQSASAHSITSPRRATSADMRTQALSEELQNWLGNERRLLAASMDDYKAHIEKLVAWARFYIDRKAGRARKMAVCFCGPTGLAHTIASAARKIGSGLEFSADHQ